MKVPAAWTRQISGTARPVLLWSGLAALTLLAGIALEMPAMLLIPVLGLGGLWMIGDVRRGYYLLWMMVPLSTEIEFQGGLSMDFPVEPLMILMTGIAVFIWAGRARQLSTQILYHPVTLLLLMHLAWIALMIIPSTGPVVSVKFFLAKVWYVIPLYFLSYDILRTEQDIRKWFLSMLIPLILTILVIIGRHALEGFSFESINHLLKPFYRNHVDYGLILGVAFPFIAILSHRWLPRLLAWGVILLIPMAVYLTYTRTAYIGLLLAAAGILIVRWKLLKYALLAALLGAGLTLYGLSSQNKYIDFAPDYDKTITHQDFGNLLEATYKMEDISTVERFYRWIAAVYMVRQRPLTGFGPNNFVDHYRSFTDPHFTTYVSDNPEMSGVHNYFLMTAVEQGIPGLIIFLSLLFIALMRAQWLYHHLKSGFNRSLLTAVIGTLFFIVFALLLNDMIETDKVGTYYFLCLAFLAIIERNARKTGEFMPGVVHQTRRR